MLPAWAWGLLWSPTASATLRKAAVSVVFQLTRQRFKMHCFQMNLNGKLMKNSKEKRLWWRCSETHHLHLRLSSAEVIPEGECSLGDPGGNKINLRLVITFATRLNTLNTSIRRDTPFPIYFSDPFEHLSQNGGQLCLSCRLCESNPIPPIQPPFWFPLFLCSPLASNEFSWNVCRRDLWGEWHQRWISWDRVGHGYSWGLPDAVLTIADISR